MNLNDSMEGRWLTPDPAGLGAIDPANPQSWNAYAYALNNPTTLTDPLGLGPQDCDLWLIAPPNPPPGPPPILPIIGWRRPCLFGSASSRKEPLYAG